MAQLYARTTEGETVAEETVLCREHLTDYATKFTAADAVGPHELCDVENSRLSCRVCGRGQS
ncbi:hypothetical protein [Mycolicibacterium sp.]|uniref:hypothetical protein n=1 Tax=Mycolicibacterium sp. TaxID=2320850 RepID=UPI00355FF2B6